MLQDSNKPIYPAKLIFYNNLKKIDNKPKNFASKLNELSKKVKAISAKWLTKNLINKFSILNGAKYFSLGIFLNLVFTLAKTIH